MRAISQDALLRMSSCQIGSDWLCRSSCIEQHSVACGAPSVQPLLRINLSLCAVARRKEGFRSAEVNQPAATAMRKKTNKGSCDYLLGELGAWRALPLSTRSSERKICSPLSCDPCGIQPTHSSHSSKRFVALKADHPYQLACGKLLYRRPAACCEAWHLS